MRSNHNKNNVITAAKKIVSDKKAVIDYSNGKISKQDLRERGVKLTMPL
jgi:hypothetical protein